MAHHIFIVIQASLPIRHMTDQSGILMNHLRMDFRWRDASPLSDDLNCQFMIKITKPTNVALADVGNGLPLPGRMQGIQLSEN